MKKINSSTMIADIVKHCYAAMVKVCTLARTGAKPHLDGCVLEIGSNDKGDKVMNKNVIDCKHGEFVPGRTLRATVKTVRKEGVLIKMPGGKGSGVISPCCWGKGVEREKALAAIHPGDEFDVVVRHFDARTCTLSLVLAACKHLMRAPRKAGKTVRKDALPPQGVKFPRKPEFKPIASGATLLWDASNLLGAIEIENAVQTLETVAGALSDQGYKPMFFIERRCLTWARCNQRTAADAAALDMFMRRSDVVLVEGGGTGKAEADCAILQMADVLPDSVCVSCDHFSDYAHMYPDIVGTNRIRSFSVAKIGGKTMILVNGIARAIVVEDGRMQKAATAPGEHSVSAQAATESAIDIAAPVVAQDADAVAAPADMPSMEANIPVGRGGLLAVADECVRRGDAKGAVRIYAKLAKRDPLAYRALAEMYREGNAVRADGKKAMHYERLARTSEKTRRACLVRDRRRRAEAIRSGHHSVDHFSAKRRKALSLATFAMQHEAICEYRKLKKARRGKASIRGCAA